MAGSIRASAAMARMVARSYPSAANRSGAGARSASGVASERLGRAASPAVSRAVSVMSTTVGHRALTFQHRRAYVVNRRWPTAVDLGELAMDVLIVGAGPTGLLLAGDLAAAGGACTILERRVEESNLTRAFGVHARTLEELDARGVADELVATGNSIDRLRLFGGAYLDL